MATPLVWALPSVPVVRAGLLQPFRKPELPCHWRAGICDLQCRLDQVGKTVLIDVSIGREHTACLTSITLTGQRSVILSLPGLT